MSNATGAGSAAAENTDARPIESAQDFDAELDGYLVDGEDAGPPEVQAELQAAEDQAPNPDTKDSAEDDPENLFGKTDKDAPKTSDAEAPSAKIRLADGTEATAEQVQEWRDGQFRTADYTRKTQDLAEQRKVLETRTGEVEAHQAAVAAALDRALAVVEAYVPTPPSTELAIQDPARYTQEMAIYQAAMAHVEQITRQREQLAAQTSQQNQAQSQAQRAELLQSERDKLFAAIPELKNDAKRQAFNQEMVKAVETYGFSPTDYAQIIDHRLIRVLADAARYQKIKAASAGGKPRQDAPRAAPQPPGRRAAAPNGSELGTALQQAKRSGNKADTARAIDAWLAAD